MANKGWKLEQIETQMKVFYKGLSYELGNESRNHFVDSWRNQGFTDRSLHKWKEVKRRTQGTKAYKYPKTKGLGRRTRAILVKSGNLRRSVRIMEQAKKYVILGSDLPYAGVHNVGTETIPKRQFMGRSHVLESKMQKLITQRVNKMFK